MTDAWHVVAMAMTGGWDEYAWPGNVNMITVQERSGLVDFQVATATTPGSAFFTVRAKNAMPFSSFNAEGETLRFKANAGTVLEIVEQKEA